MPQLKLYHYWRSSCSWRVRWALAYKGINYESIAVNLLQGEQKKPEFLAINPLGQVPSLVVEEGFVLNDSLAIIEYLEEQYAERPLLPKAPKTRALARELAMLIASGIQPMQNLRVIHRYSEDVAKREAWIRLFIEDGLQAFERRISGFSGNYCLGEELSLADLFLIPQVYNALRFQVPLRPYPRCEAIYQHCLKTPACDTAAPHHQPGAQP